MFNGVSPRTIRHRKRKQLIVERNADMPSTLLTVDTPVFIRRDANNLPDDCYADIVPSYSQIKRLPTSTMKALEINYQTQTIQENESSALDMQEVTIDGSTFHGDSESTTAIPPVMTGGDECNTTMTPLHEVSLKIASLASQHNLKDVTVNAVLKLISEVSMFYPTSVPRNIHVVEENICKGVFDCKFTWKCPRCNKFTSYDIFDATSSRVCCGTKMKRGYDHYIHFDVTQILFKSIFSVYDHIKLDELLARKPYLRQLRQNLNFTSEDVSLTINIDGVSVSGSSKCTLYPVLAFFDGTNRSIENDNIVMLGFWLGPAGGKPNVDILLKPIITQIKYLGHNGIQWTKDNILRTSRVIISTCLCDSVARPVIQGLTQWNGLYGCSFCLHKESGHYYSPNITSSLRSNEEYRVICQMLSRNVPVQTFGVRYASPLIDLDYFDMILGFPPCIMHSGYLGVCRTLTETLMSSKTDDKYYISPNEIQQIDNYLLAIQPPARVSRTPRSLKLLAWFKAHELSMWLLYYSPPILQKCLPQEYFEHWLSYVRGLSLLLTNEITEFSIQESTNNLQSFYTNTIRLYGKTTCTYNVHLASHLPRIASKIGPLQHYSMAPFETFNMTLRSFITSSNEIGKQIARRYLRNLQCKFLTSQSDLVRENNRRTSWHARRCPDNSTFFCPKDSCELQYLIRVTSSKGHSLLSLLAGKESKRNSCCYMLVDSRVIEIDYFVCTSCDKKMYAIGTIYDLVPSFDLCHYKKAVFNDNGFCPVNHVVDVVLKIVCRGEIYFVKFLSNVENYKE